MIWGPYTGDPDLMDSYTQGKHWKGMNGYQVVEGVGEYLHYFGGQTWELPMCPNCKKSMHQIFTFDLTDSRISELHTGGLKELPLISCLNCSGSWEVQLFKIDADHQTIRLLTQEDEQHWIQDSELRLPVPLPVLPMNLEQMTEEDIPFDEEHYDNALERLGTEYVCRLLGAPLYAVDPIDRECPWCKKEMLYVSTVTEESYIHKRKLIPVVDFLLGETFIYFLFCKDCLVVKTEMQGT